jgi:hypothetical protein
MAEGGILSRPKAAAALPPYLSPLAALPCRNQT